MQPYTQQNTGQSWTPQEVSAWEASTGQKFPTQAPVTSPYMQPTRTPTVISDEYVRNTTIPEINNRANSLLPGGVKIGSNGEWITNQSANQIQDDQKSSGMGSSYKDTLSSLMSDIDESALSISPEQQSILDLLQQQSDNISRQNIANIQSKYSARTQAVQESQRRSTETLKNALNLAGSSRYSPLTAEGALSSKEKFDLNTLNELSREEQNLIAEAQNAKSSSDFKILQEKLDLLENKRKEKIDLAKDIAKQIEADNKMIREKMMKEDEDIGKLIVDAGGAGAPRDLLAKAQKAGNLVDAVSILGDYLGSTSGIVGEYNFYKRDAQRRGVVPVDFEAYQEADANRKRIASTIVGPSGYTPVQLDVVKEINNEIEANKTYQSTNAMGKAVNAVKDALSKKNGVSDIAAINQFQKIIDEGAVTRDQDVVLIQGAQSALDTLRTKEAQLRKGEKLSDSQRKQMLDLVESIYATQKEVLKNDPFLNSQKTYAELNGVRLEDTILKGFIDTVGDELLDKQQSAKEAVDNYYQDNPNDRNVIDLMYQDGKSEEDIVEYLQSRGKPITFNTVVSDTYTPAQIREGIASIESGGDYQAVSPVNKNGEKAYGKYQILSSNIGAWAKEALGRLVTVSEFLKSPSIQDRIAQYMIDKYYKKYGNADDVAAVWFSGRPLENNRSKDVTGTDVPTYVARFRKALSSLT